METTNKIPEQALPLFENALAELNKRATKLKVTPVTFSVDGKEIVKAKDATGVEYDVVYLLVTIHGTTPKLDGWRLVACIEQLEKENMVRCVPGETCPVEYRTTGYHCDHCGTDRRRKEVFVLGHDDGRHVQVGRNCIADFLGGKDPEALLRWAAFMAEFGKFIESCGAEGDYYGCGGGPVAYTIERVIETTAIVVRRLGWISRKMVEGSMDPSTSDTVSLILNPPKMGTVGRYELERFIEKRQLYIENSDKELAEKAIEWGKTLNGTDYEYNLGVLCRAGIVPAKSIGLAVSLIPAYQRHLGIVAEQKAKPQSQHVGEVGKRTEFTLTVINKKYFEGAYGVKTLVRFEDENQNTLIWWASADTDWLPEGEVVNVKATVKKHGDYKGTNQTELSRVAEVKAKAA